MEVRLEGRGGRGRCVLCRGDRWLLRGFFDRLIGWRDRVVLALLLASLCRGLDLLIAGCWGREALHKSGSAVRRVGRRRWILFARSWPRLRKMGVVWRGQCLWAWSTLQAARRAKHVLMCCWIFGSILYVPRES